MTTEYAALWKFLCETDELYTATERICKEYERPAVNNVQARFDVAQKYINFSFIAVDDTSDTEVKDIAKKIKELADRLDKLMEGK